MLLYHHCMDLETVVYNEIVADPKYSSSEDEIDEGFKQAYFWLEKEIRFYPLFLAVGATEEDISMTGYQNQWAVNIGSEPAGKREDGSDITRKIYRKAGEFPNYVLFSFEHVDGVFTDYCEWNIPLNRIMSGASDITTYEKKLLFKYSWPKSKWLKKARDTAGSVQLVAPKLDLPNADRIWVRNKKTKYHIESMGFNNVEVKRIPV